MECGFGRFRGMVHKTFVEADGFADVQGTACDTSSAINSTIITCTVTGKCDWCSVLGRDSMASRIRKMQAELAYSTVTLVADRSGYVAIIEEQTGHGWLDGACHLYFRTKSFQNGLVDVFGQLFDLGEW